MFEGPLSIEQRLHKDVSRIQIETAMGHIATAVTQDNWQEFAVCAETGPDAFYPEPGASFAQAKKVCGGCDVRDYCLEEAIENNVRGGLWGGLSESERDKLKRSGNKAS